MDGGNAKFCMEQNWPCKLYDGIHAIKGLSRIYTELEKHNLWNLELRLKPYLVIG